VVSGAFESGERSDLPSHVRGEGAPRFGDGVDAGLGRASSAPVERAERSVHASARDEAPQSEGH